MHESVFLNGAPVVGFGVGGAGSDRLAPGESLSPGQQLIPKSAGGRGRVTLQGDGNVVLSGGSGMPLWDSGTHGKPVVKLVMQTDGNLVAYDSRGGAHWNSNTQRNPGAYALFQGDGNFVVYSKDNRPLWNSNTQNWTKRTKSIAPIVEAITAPVTAPAQAIAKLTKDIPVVGDITRIAGDAVSGPANLVNAIASGARIDKALMQNFKDQLKLVKDIAPYAQTIVSFVPGIGTGVAAAIAAGAAIAEGKSIDEAMKAGLRGAIPGGPVALAAFDTAMGVAAGKRLDQAALESARNLIPDGPARKAFDVGVAVATGQSLQSAVVSGLTSLAPAALKELGAVGQKVVAASPALVNAAKNVSGVAKEGFDIAAGALGQKGISEAALKALRSKLSADQARGFDAALKSQEGQIAWLKDVTGAPPPMRSAPAKPAPAAPATAPPPMRVATKPTNATAPSVKTASAVVPTLVPGAATSITPGVFPPYPAVGTLGVGGGCGGDIAGTKWSSPVPVRDKAMKWAGYSAVNGSRGRPRMVAGPDGTTYLFSLDGAGNLVAQQAVA